MTYGPRWYGQSSRFNEAPIHESGKWIGIALERRIQGCFNEAPIHESGKCIWRNIYDRPQPASMRPRFMNRGSVVDMTAETMHRRVASMRPRFMNRGSLDLLTASDDVSGASMRPRFMNRGSLDDLPEGHPHKGLQ